MSSNTKFRENLNFRDLGGKPTEDGRVVKSNLLYRSATLCYFDEEELKALEELNLKVIFDLRSTQEAEIYPEPRIPNVRYIQQTAFEKTKLNFSVEAMSKEGEEGKEKIKELHRYYENIPFGNKAYKEILHLLLEGETPILYHCASGKDRTGVATIVILYLLGVKEDAIKEEYLIQSEYCKKQLQDIDPVEHPELYELMSMLHGTTENTFNHIMNKIHSTYPTREELYEKEYDLSKKDIETLREMYLE